MTMTCPPWRSASIHGGGAVLCAAAGSAISASTLARNTDRVRRVMGKLSPVKGCGETSTPLAARVRCDLSLRRRAGLLWGERSSHHVRFLGDHHQICASGLIGLGTLL